MAGLKNLLMVVIDCLGSDALLSDRKSAVTPNTDALRERGVTFPNTITAATDTMPSFASLLTGLYPSAHGVRSLGSHKLPTGCATLAGILTEQGYQTAAFLTGPLGKETAIGDGFNQFEDRDPEDVSFGSWGHEFLAGFPSRFREPWFVLLPLWELHPPRYVAPTCRSEEYG